MTDTLSSGATLLDTYIKSPAPPKDPDAQYVYNEQQFGSLEKAIRKHHDKILEVNENAKALYEFEVNARTTADSAIVETIETLKATVDGNSADTSAQIQNIQRAQADADSATAEKITTLEAKVDSGDSQNLALIREEAKTRATKVDALASKVSALEASVKVGQTESRAMVKQETLARATADSAEASARTSLQSYVGWDGGSYTSNLTQSMSTKVSKTDGASYEWSVKGTIDGVTGGLRLQGAKRLNPTTGLVENTSSLIIDANTTINGDLLVNGTISNGKLGTGSVTTTKIAANSVGRTAASTAYGDSSTSVYCEAGGTILIIGNFYGYANSPATTGGLYLFVNGGQVALTSLTNASDGSGTSSAGFFVASYANGPTNYGPFTSWYPQTRPILLPSAAVYSYPASYSGTYTITAQARAYSAGGWAIVGPTSVLAISLSR